MLRSGLACRRDRQQVRPQQKSSPEIRLLRVYPACFPKSVKVAESRTVVDIPNLGVRKLLKLGGMGAHEEREAAHSCDGDASFERKGRSSQKIVARFN